MDNRELVETYYRNHRDELLVFASSRLGGNTMAAEDMVQELFLHLLSLQQPLLQASVHGLVYTCLHHLLNDHFRRMAYQRHYEELLVAGMATAHASAESGLALREATEQMERGLLRVAPVCRNIYRLHIYDNMKTAEIAQQTGDSYKSVEYRLGLARKEVRHFMKRTS